MSEIQRATSIRFCHLPPTLHTGDSDHEDNSDDNDSDDNDSDDQQEDKEEYTNFFETIRQAGASVSTAIESLPPGILRKPSLKSSPPPSPKSSRRTPFSFSSIMPSKRAMFEKRSSDQQQQQQHFDKVREDKNKQLRVDIGEGRVRTIASKFGSLLSFKTASKRSSSSSSLSPPMEEKLEENEDDHEEVLWVEMENEFTWDTYWMNMDTGEFTFLRPTNGIFTTEGIMAAVGKQLPKRKLLPIEFGNFFEPHDDYDEDDDEEEKEGWL